MKLLFISQCAHMWLQCVSKKIGLFQNIKSAAGTLTKSQNW